MAEKVAGKYLGFVKRVARTPVIVFDDIALRKYNHDEANVLLEIIEERYDKHIFIITSQVEPDGWKSLFDDTVICEAILDRLTNPSEKIALKGDSYRKKKGRN